MLAKWILLGAALLGPPPSFAADSAAVQTLCRAHPKTPIVLVTDLGFMRMAETIGPILHKLLK